MSGPAWAQAFRIHGTVQAATTGEGLPFAQVFAVSSGVGAVADSTGHFTLEATLPTPLVGYSVGYQPDTLHIHDQAAAASTISFRLKASYQLAEVTVVESKSATALDHRAISTTLNMGMRELRKAACCNLAESFETSPSIDASFSNALTGQRQISLLGLAGTYVPITTELVPSLRGPAASAGLALVPGPWLESIQITKGPASATAGPESVAGQINLELAKPLEPGDTTKKERILLNGYANQMSRLEGNAVWRSKPGKVASYAVMGHANTQPVAGPDRNQDGFADMPSGRGYSVLARTKLVYGDWQGQAALWASQDLRLGGQTTHSMANHLAEQPLYQTRTSMDRHQAWAKLGKTYRQPYKSLGFIASGILARSDNRFGNRVATWQDDQLSLQGLYQTQILDSRHRITLSANYLADLGSQTVDSLHLKTSEHLPGLSAEYAWSPNPRLTIAPGLRTDYSSLTGLELAPRLHLRYDLSDKATLRLSAGRARRLPWVVADNMGWLVSGRALSLISAPRPERSWGTGASYNLETRLWDKKLNLTTDIFGTLFTKALLTDVEVPGKLSLYTAKNGARSLAAQITADYVPIRRLELRLGYRYTASQAHYQERGWAQRPLQPVHRALANVAYTTRNRWVFDLTHQLNGPRRLTGSQAQPADWAPWYSLVNAQVSKTFAHQLEAYLGAENLLDYRIRTPILGADQPFGPEFDAGQVWGPIIGRMVYIGVRWRI